MSTPARGEKDEFYVGYLPLPWGHSRFLRIAIPLTLWLMVFVSAGIAWTQRHPGDAVWDDATERDWVGVLRAAPYPMLLVESGDDAGSIALLVEQGKLGATRAKQFDGARVTLRGWRLQRDGRRIIELHPADDAITRQEGTPAPPAPEMIAAEARAEIVGEIMDAKCFLGAMKPGEGLAHKACAILCITGGIPPMLVSREGGSTRYYLLTDEQGGPMPRELIPLVGEPVRATGTLARIGDLDMLRLSARGLEHCRTHRDE